MMLRVWYLLFCFSVIMCSSLHLGYCHILFGVDEKNSYIVSLALNSKLHLVKFSRIV